MPSMPFQGRADPDGFRGATGDPSPRHGAYVRAGAGVGERARCSAAKRTAMPPSPTAGATIFVEPERTSPTAKMPGRLVQAGTGPVRAGSTPRGPQVRGQARGR